jgi:hypothetical protein
MAPAGFIGISVIFGKLLKNRTDLKSSDNLTGSILNFLTRLPSSLRIEFTPTLFGRCPATDTGDTGEIGFPGLGVKLEAVAPIGGSGMRGADLIGFGWCPAPLENFGNCKYDHPDLPSAFKLNSRS